MSSPFFDFVDSINHEVNSINNRLMNAGRSGQRSLRPVSRISNWLLPQDEDLMPPVDMLEREREYEVGISVPGVASHDDIQLEYRRNNNEIIVSGEIPALEEDAVEDGWRVRERAHGRFKRAIGLPEKPGIDAEHIEAQYKDGVLKLKVPKLEDRDQPDEVRRIAIGSKQ